jgi:hypothetical protein
MPFGWIGLTTAAHGTKRIVRLDQSMSAGERFSDVAGISLAPGDAALIHAAGVPLCLIVTHKTTRPRSKPFGPPLGDVC